MGSLTSERGVGARNARREMVAQWSIERMRMQWVQDDYEVYLRLMLGFKLNLI